MTRNRIISFVNRTYHKFLFSFNTFIEYYYLKFIGVKIGRVKLSFRGWTSFFKNDLSQIKIGDNCTFVSSNYANHIGLNHKCVISAHTSKSSIQIGNNVGMSATTINCWDSIIIGNDVRIGANCVIMDGDFHIDDPRVHAPRPIVIEDRVWIGANVVVLKGVKIGEGTVIGMNSVVTKDIPANCIAAGNPCQIIRYQ